MAAARTTVFKQELMLNKNSTTVLFNSSRKNFKFINLKIYLPILNNFQIMLKYYLLGYASQAWVDVMNKGDYQQRGYTRNIKDAITCHAPDSYDSNLHASSHGSGNHGIEKLQEIHLVELVYQQASVINVFYFIFCFFWISDLLLFVLFSFLLFLVWCFPFLFFELLCNMFTFVNIVVASCSANVVPRVARVIVCFCFVLFSCNPKGIYYFVETFNNPIILNSRIDVDVQATTTNT